MTFDLIRSSLHFVLPLSLPGVTYATGRSILLSRDLHCHNIEDWLQLFSQQIESITLNYSILGLFNKLEKCIFVEFIAS